MEKGQADGGKCLVIRDGKVALRGVNHSVISQHLRKELKPCWHHLPEHFTQEVLKRDAADLGISMSCK